MTTPNSPIPAKCQSCPIFAQRHQTQPGIKATYQRKFIIHTELDIVCAYICEEKSSPQLALEKDCTQDTIQNIVRCYHQPIRTLREAQLLRRGSKELTFPLSTEIPHLLTHPNTKPFIPHLIAVMLLTDGNAGYRQGHRPYITFTNKAKTLHAIFADLIHYYYDQPPSAYYRPYWSKPNKQGSKAYYTTYNRIEDTHTILNDLLTLSPTFRTRPKLGQSWEEYLQTTPQPTIQFLFTPLISKEIHEFIIRLAMSAEGTITPLFTSDSRFPYPHLTFACKHPLLKAQWKKYFDTQGFAFSRTNEMIEATKLKIAKKFLNLGGFIEGVQVKINSYYKGLDKEAVLKAILIDRKNHPINPSLQKSDKHEFIRKRAKQFQKS
ncbi:MAG: hypothetical protein ACFE89_06470 [Candidatus Hodarchaeota archaeon]